MSGVDLQEMLLAARAGIETILKGTTFDLDRNLLQARSIPDMMEQIKSVSQFSEARGLSFYAGLLKE